VHCDVFSLRCFEICNDCMVSVIHRFWNIDFLLGLHMEWLLTRTVRNCSDSDEVSVQTFANRPPRGLLAFPPISILHTNCTGSSLEKELAQVVLAKDLCRLHILLERSCETRADCSTLRTFSWFFLHGYSRKGLIHVRLLYLPRGEGCCRISTRSSDMTVEVMLGCLLANFMLKDCG